jgi:hypothetical protein
MSIMFTEMSTLAVFQTISFTASIYFATLLLSVIKSKSIYSQCINDVTYH